jgi:hypothetical protein
LVREEVVSEGNVVHHVGIAADLGCLSQEEEEYAMRPVFKTL